VLLWRHMADNITQVVSDTLEKLRKERAKCEAEIRRLDLMITALAGSSAPTSTKAAPPRAEKPAAPRATTERVRKAEKNVRAKDFWERRKTQRKSR
jgi:hypothetical protein